jgi:uncharacterized protein YgiM (DUF1202 family)
MSANRLAIALLTVATTAFAAVPSFARVTPQAPATNNTVLLAATTCTTTGSSVNVRSGPGKQFRVVGSLPAGASVSLGGVRNDSSGVRWFRVSGGGVRGWVRGDFICDL